MLSILALIAATAGAPQSPSAAATRAPNAANTQVASQTATQLPSYPVTVVYLGCQIHQTALAECQVVNNDPVEPGAAAEALKLASGMSVPAGLGERLGGHIVVKLNIKQ